MISVFYASLSVVAAAVLGLLVGAIAGVWAWDRYTHAFSRVMSTEKYRNTAGAAWLADEVYKRIKGGATTDDIVKWLDAKGNEITEGRFNTSEFADDLSAAWRAERAREERWDAVRALRGADPGVDAIADQVKVAHTRALDLGLSDETSEYFGYIEGWLGSVNWHVEQMRAEGELPDA